MGRQIAIVATINDENKLISYLSSIADIVLIDYFADTEANLLSNTLNSTFPTSNTYFIWNKDFKWNYQIGTNVYGKYYITNKNDAPLIEISRQGGNSRGDGRIYWAKYFSAPNGITYDIDKFSSWYETVIKWVRKNSAGKVKESWTTYYLPEAWQDYQEKCK